MRLVLCGCYIISGIIVIIVGLRNTSNKSKYIFKDKIQTQVKNINPYLVEGANLIISGRSKPLSSFPNMRSGNMPNDGGGLILLEEEAVKLQIENPQSSKWIKGFMGASEFIKGYKRYCLWIPDDELKEAKEINIIKERLETVKRHREKSTEISTREKASHPNHFYFTSHKNTDSIIVPKVSSERRDYIPIGFLNSQTVISDLALVIYDAKPWVFAVCTSRLHMVWVKAVGGKMKTDYRYSPKLCYNTFPFPEISTKQKENLNLYIFAILDERAKYSNKTLAQLYNPDTMPTGLRKAHQELDEAIEQCYRLQPFKNDAERLEYLFKLYEEMIKKDTLFAKEKKTTKQKSNKE